MRLGEEKLWHVLVMTVKGLEPLRTGEDGVAEYEGAGGDEDISVSSHTQALTVQGRNRQRLVRSGVCL